MSLESPTLSAHADSARTTSAAASVGFVSLPSHMTPLTHQASGLPWLSVSVDRASRMVTAVVVLDDLGGDCGELNVQVL